MGIYSQTTYQKFELFLLDAIKTGSSSLVVTIPGLGIRHFIKKFLEKNTNLNISHIESVDQPLNELNILDVDFYKNPDALEVADRYFKTANLNQKFVLIVNDPGFLQTKKYQSSFLFGRTYLTYYFKVRDLSDTEKLIKEIAPQATDIDMLNVYKISGGISRLIKFLVIHSEKVNLKIADLLEDEELSFVLKPTIDVIRTCPQQTLIDLGLKNEDNHFNSLLLESFFQENPLDQKFSIQIDSDLSFIEDGIMSPYRLVKIESDVLKYLETHNVIERTMISDLKWGEGKYDEFSDQAINKTIQRLNDKMANHILISIPKIGYKLQRKS